MTEAHAKLSVVRNCSRFSLLCGNGGGETAGRRGVVSSSKGGEEADSTQGERIWRSLGRQKVKRASGNNSYSLIFRDGDGLYVGWGGGGCYVC